jgi:multiple sugar transport system permease protein
MSVLSLPETLGFVLNSLVVSLGSVIFKLLVATPAAYVLSRVVFRGRDAIAFLFIATVMIPALVVFIPLYVFMAGMHMVNSYFSYILVLTGFGTPFIIWILRAYFSAIPVQL